MIALPDPVLVYVAGPFRAVTPWTVEQNVRAAEAIGFALAGVGVVPVIPHTMFRFFDKTQTDRFWLDGTLELLRRCDAVCLLTTWEQSAGARGEKTEADRLGLPVFRSVDDVAKWAASR